jgi:hypothetical protein
MPFFGKANAIDICAVWLCFPHYFDLLDPVILNKQSFLVPLHNSLVYIWDSAVG